MKSTNAVVALVASQAVIAAEWLAQHYAHVTLSDYWKAEIAGGSVTVVIYVGKNGVKAALLRCVEVAKAVWYGAASTRQEA